jgi:hypothetical protein
MRSFKGYTRHYPDGKGRGHAVEDNVGSAAALGEVKGSEKAISSEKDGDINETSTASSGVGGGVASPLMDGGSLEAHAATAMESLPPVSQYTSPPSLSSVNSAPSQPDPVNSDPASAASPEAILNAKYKTLAEEYTNHLIAMSEEGVQDGWLDMGSSKDVHRMKKMPESSGPPINSVRGYGTINTPPEFLLRLLNDPTHATTLDDLLREARVVEKLSDSVTLAQLLYKGVWPTSPRDLSILSIAGQVNASTWVSSGTSVTDPRIPQEKGYVRAELLGGGYVIKSIPDQPECCGVTYVACIDLKGSIPSFAVNKIAESQPMCVSNLRNLAERLYQQMKNDLPKLTAFEEKPIPSVFSVKETVAEPAVSGTLENRIAQSVWHFDPASEHNVPDCSGEHNGFQTPPIERSDDEAELPPSPGSPTVPTTPPNPGDSVFHTSHSDSTLNHRAENGLNTERSSQSVSTAALRLSPYTRPATPQSVKVYWHSPGLAPRHATFSVAPL